jgi:chaperone modulatory protein CbpM
MTEISRQMLDLEQFCAASDIEIEIVVEIVEIGIIEPRGSSPDDWLFDTDMLSTTQRAMRLHRDLDINWSGIALALDLIQERDSLRRQLAYLQQQLSRFVEDSAD